MKKLSLLLTIFIPVLLISQPCLPDGIEFTTQEQIDNFQTDYPNCTEIEGSVLIRGDDIYNLNGLSVITAVNGFLTIGNDWDGCNPNLSNLSGLENLYFVGGSLVLVENGALNSLTALGNLTTVGGGLAIEYNYNLTSLNGLDNITTVEGDLRIIHNDILTSLNGLQNIAHIGGHLEIAYNHSLSILTGFESLTSIGEYLKISDNQSMYEIDGFINLNTIGGDMGISGNDSLISLSGFNNLLTIEEDFWINSNHSLTSLSGLDNSASILRDLNIIHNSLLSLCEIELICNYLEAPNGEIEIHNNAYGCNSQKEVEEACSSCLPEGITITTQAQIDSFAIHYPNCTEIEGYVEISGEGITNLNGLNRVISIGGHTIVSNTALINLSGLNSLKTIGGFLRIDFNDSLKAMTGLENLTSIEETFAIGNIFYSSNPQLINLAGLENLTYIGGDLRLYNNLSLTSLTGLENLHTINGGLVIGGDPTSWGNAGNPSLKDISALVNITDLNTTLRILYNDSLTNLAGLDSLISIGNDVWIEGNNSLSNLDGLKHLSSFGEYLAINNNPELLSIAGIGNIEVNSISDLQIRYNNSLATCAVQSICNYLASPNGTIEVHDNAPGCNSKLEVEEACNSSISEIGALLEIVIHPNPFSASTTIEYELNKPETVRIKIYNHLGKQVDVIEERQQHGSNKAVWTPKNLPDGIYYFKLQAGEQLASGKLMLLD